MFTTSLPSYLLIAIVEDQKRLPQQQDNPGIGLLKSSSATTASLDILTCSIIHNTSNRAVL